MSTTNNPAAPPGGDPSMEDILASIRRILSEDEPAPETREDHPAPSAPPLPAPPGPSGPAAMAPAPAPEAYAPAPRAPEPRSSEPRPAEPRLVEPRPSEPRLAAVEPVPMPRAAPPPEDQVFVLDQSMIVEEPEAHAPLEHVMTEEPPDPAPASPPAPPPLFSPPPLAPSVAPLPPGLAAPEAPFAPPGPGDRLLAPEAAAAAASSMGHLVRALSERSTQVYRGGPTIEDLVREELRPILKQWLDTNLAPMVERFVRAEIERVVGRTVP